MRFDLTDLQLFVHILDCGTLTAAAGRAHMTLASASARHGGATGLRLLARQARGVRPTAAGHTLGQHARDVLARMQRLRGDMAEYGAGLAGHVRVCGNTSAVGEHLPLAVSGFLRSHPRVALELQECGSAEVLDRLRQGLCDIGVASDAQDTTGLQATPWRPDPLVAVLPRGHRLRTRLALQELLAEDWVGLPHDAALQMLVRQQAALLEGPSGGQLRWRAQLQHLDSICQLVGQGVGVAVMPAAAAQRLAQRRPRRALERCLGPAPAAAVHGPGRPVARPCQAVAGASARAWFA